MFQSFFSCSVWNLILSQSVWIFLLILLICSHLLSLQSKELVKAYPPFVNFFEMSKETIVRCEKQKPRFHAFLKVLLRTVRVCLFDWMARIHIFSIRDLQERGQREKTGKPYDIWHFFTETLQTIALSISEQLMYIIMMTTRHRYVLYSSLMHTHNYNVS